MKTTPVSSFAHRLKPPLAFGVIALGASGAQGAIVYTDFPDVTVGPDPSSTNGNHLDLDAFVKFDLGLQVILANDFGLSGDQFRFRAADSFVAKNNPIGTPGSYQVLIANHGFTSVLGANVTVDAGNTSSTSDVGLESNLSDRYAGVRISAPGGGFNFGWIRFSTGAAAPNGLGAATITLKDAAYETTVGQSIQTGQVPEPSTAALLTLAGGAMALRRRRQSQAA